MATDSNQTPATSPIGNAADTSQQDWLELDQQGLGGETLKAKKWTAKSRVVDSSQHIGNIHTGTEKAVELDKSDTLTGDPLQGQNRQENTTTEELDSVDVTGATSVTTKRSTDYSDQREEQSQQQTAETSGHEKEQESVVQQSGSDSLVFEERFEDNPTERSSRESRSKSPATQEVLPQEAVDSTQEAPSKAETTPLPPDTPAPVIPATPAPAAKEEEEPEEIIIESSASAPTLSASDSYGLEDNGVAIEFSSTLTDTDGSETLSIMIEGVPAGATLSAGINLGDGSWKLSSGELADLTLLPPPNSDEDFSLTITATSTERHGGATSSVSEVIDVFMEAVADAPTLTASAATGEEDTAIALDITAALTDLDGSETLSAVLFTDVPEGAVLSAGKDNKDGTWSVEAQDLDGLTITAAENSNADFNLGIAVTAIDSDGVTATSTTTVPVNVIAVADDAIITGTGDATTEDTSQSISGQLNIIDPDANEAHFNAASIEGSYGSLVIAEDGAWTYHLHNSADNVQQLNAGETVTDTITVRSADGSSHDLVMTVNGTNDAPSIGTTTVKSAPEDGAMVTGAISSSDIDTNDSVIYSAQAADGLTFNDDGSYSFDPGHAIYQSLAAGETTTISVAVTAEDSHGATDSENLLITLTGTNDTPVVSGAVTLPGGIEDTPQSFSSNDLLAKATDIDTSDTLSVTNVSVDPAHGTLITNPDGTFTFSPKADFNGEATITYDVTDGAESVSTSASVSLSAVNDSAVISGEGTTLTEDTSQSATGQLAVTDVDSGQEHFNAENISGTYGSLEIAEDGAWTYSLNNSADNIQQLGAGDIVTDTITISSADGTTHDLVMTVNGTNDNLVLGTITAKSTTEDGAMVTGAISSSDIDTNDSVTYSAQAADGLTFNGDGSYSFDPAHTSYQSLAAGETTTVTVAVTAEDSHGATDSENLIVTLTGTNDIPVVSGAVTLPGGTEDTPQSFSSNDLLAKATDIDISDTLSVTNVSVDPAHGTLITNPDGTFVFNPKADYNGEVTITYDVTDGTESVSTSASVSLSAVNDSAVISGEGTTLTEDTSQSATGQLAVTDVDSGQEHFNAENLSGTYGSLEIAEDGAWAYSLNNSADNIQQLGAGDIVTDTITISSADGTTHDLVMTVNGTNDNPVLGTITAKSTTEDGAMVTGAISSSDIDTNDSVTYSAQATDGLTFNDDGSYSFDPGHTSYQSLAAGETTTVTVAVTAEDNHGATDSENLLITLTGTNDTPVVSGAVTLPGGTEDTPQSFSSNDLLVNASDIDSTDTLSVANLSVDPAHGTLITNPDGTFTFSPKADYNGEVTITYDVTDGTDFIPTTAAINLDADNDAPVITSSTEINITEDSMEGFSGYGEIWEGDVYSVVTQAEMLAHLGISDVDSDTFTVSLADANTAWHDGLQANDSVFTSDTLSSGSVNGDEAVIQVTREFLTNYPNVEAEIGDFYFDHVDFDKLSDGEVANINFSVQVSDGETTSEASDFQIVVTGSNDVPVVSGAVTLSAGSEDTAQNFSTADLLANTTDIDSTDTLSVANVSVDPDQGVLTSNPDGTFTFTPKENYNGEVRINYEVTDGIEIVPATASLELAAVNDNPIAVDDQSHNQQVQLSGNNTSLIADSSVIQDNSDPYTVSLDITPAEQDYGYIISNGGQTGAASGFFVTRGVYGKDSSIYQVGVADENQFIVFQGGQAENGQQSNLTFTYDGQDLTVYQDGVDITATGTISTRAGRDLPMQNVTLGAPSNIPTSYEFKGETDNVQIYDSSLNASEVEQIQNGEIPDSDGLLVHYSFEGNAPLTDQSGNGHDLQPHGDIQFSENSAPELSTGEDTPLTISAESLLANDTDVDGDTLSVSAVSEEVTDSNGQVVGAATLDDEGNIVFTPGNALDSLAEGENKEVSFTYTVSDGQGGSDTAAVSVTIAGTNDAPVVKSVDLGAIQEDQPIKFSAKALLEGAKDVDSDSLHVLEVHVDKEYGTMEYGQDADGNIESFAFVPNENFNGEDVPIYFTVSDGQSKTEGKASIDVTAVNDVPTLEIVSTATVTEDGSVSISFTAADVDGTIESTVARAEHGTITVNDDNTLTYTPDENYHGTDTIRVMTTDNDGATATQTSSVTISDVNDAPTLEVQSTATVAEDGSVAINFRAADLDGSISSTEANVAEAQGTAVVNDDGTITFTPAENFHGKATITTVTTDDDGATATQTSTITVSDVNDAPTLRIDSTATVTEDGSVAINFSAADVDGTIQSTIARAEHGSITVNDDSTLTYTPDENYHGTDTIRIMTTDDDGATATQTSSVTISDVNDAPILEVQSTATVAEDGSVAINFRAADLDGTVKTTATAEHGTTTVNDDGTITYTPDSNFHGTDSVVVTTVDDDGATVTQNSSITISNDIEPPTLRVDSTATVAEDGSVSITYHASDSDGTIQSTVARAEHGTVTVNDDDTITYVPDPDYHGTDTIRVMTTDDDGATATQNSTITVSDVNDAPTLEIQSTATVTEDGSVSLNFRAADVDGTITSTLANVAKSQGTAVVNDDGTITFTAAENFHGKATITTVTTDDDGATATQTSTVTVSDVNDAPTLRIDSKATVKEDGSVSISFSAADVDGTIQSTVAKAEHGTVTVNDDNTLTYTPDENYHGSDTIRVMTTDDDRATATQTSSVTVSDVNDAPTLEVQSTATVAEDGSVSLNFKAVDVDGTVESTVAQAEHGVVTVNDDGTITYVPDSNYNGTDTVKVMTTDDNGAIATQTSTVTVSAVNDAPVVSDTVILREGIEDTSQSFTTADLLANSTDIDTTDTLSVTNVSVDPDQGVLTSNPDGTFTFTPKENYNGEVAISYDVTDGIETVAATAEINLSSVNDGPDAVNDVIGDVTSNAMSFDQSAQINTTSIVDTADTGDQVTVSFDMNWDGTNSVMPVGFDCYDLWITGNNIGFNTGNGDLYGVNTAADLVDGNHTITAVFTQGDVQANELYIDGVKQDLSQLQNSPNNSRADITDNLNLSGWDINSGYKFSGQLDNVQLHDRALTDEEAQDISEGGVVEDGLVAHYDFEGPDPLIDKSNNGNDAEIGAGNPQVVEHATFFTEDTTIEIPSATLLANDTDSDGDSLSITDVSEDVLDSDGNIAGTANQDDNGNIVFTPGDALDSLAKGDSKDVSFTYSIDDGHGGTDTATVTIQIQGTDDKPVLVADSAVITEHGSTHPEMPNTVHGNLLTNDSDVDDGSSLSVTGIGFSHTMSFDGSAQVNTTNIVDTADTGDQVTVSFDMNWDGTDSVMPVGFDCYDLWITGNNIGFNTGNGDLYGASNASDLANGSHTITAVFTQGDVQANELYIDGIKQDLSQLQNSPNNSRADITDELNLSGWDVNSGYKFSGQLDNVQLHDRALTADEARDISEGDVVESGLVAHYDFEGAEPLADKSGNDNAAEVGAGNPQAELIEGSSVEGVTVVNGTFGTLTIDQDGSYSYELDDANNSVNALAEGETLNESFSIDVTEADTNLTLSEELNFTINGTDDIPVLLDDKGSISEDSPEPLTGNILSNDTDVDNGSSFSVTGLSGITVLQDNFDDGNADGWAEISYNERDTGNWQVVDGVIGERSNSAKGIIAHDMGENADSSNYEVTVDVHANAGATGNNNVGITFGYEDNSNYYMVKWDDYSENYSEGSTHKDFKLIKVEDGRQTVIDQIDHAELPSDFALSVKVSDDGGIAVTVDGEEKLTAEDEHPAIHTIGLNTDDNDGGVSYDNVSVINNHVPIEDATSIDGLYGTLTLNPDGSYSYELDDANTNVQKLHDGEHLTESFTVNVLENQSDKTGSESLSITINGTNDGPVAVDDSTIFTLQTVFEDTFNDGNADGWTEISYNETDSGNWQVADGALGEGSNSAKGIMAHDMGDDADSSNYEVAVDVHANAGDTYNNNVGITFGYEDNDNYYMVKWDDYSDNYSESSTHKDFKLIKVENGRETVIDQVDQADLPSDFNLSVNVSDDNGISIKVDGTEMLTAAEEHPAINTIGLNTDDNDSGISYDNVSVKVASDQTITTDEDTPLVLSAESLLANDTDVEGDTLSITAVSENVVDNDGNVVGTATQDDDGNILFTPGSTLNSLTEGENKEVSLSYTISDGQGGTDTANVTVQISGTNDAPVVKNIDLGAINEDQPVKFSAKALLEGAKDVDGDALHVLEVHVDKEYGIMEYGQDVDGNIESFAFVPNENFNGEDVPIYFTVSDGQIETEGKAVIDVTAVNDAPVIEGSVELGAIKEDTEIKFEASDLLKTTTDVDGDKLSILDVSVDKEFGSIEFSTNKEGNVETVKFIPNENFTGEDVPINFVATDGQAKVEGKSTIDVTAVNEEAIVDSSLFTTGRDSVNLATADENYGNNKIYDALGGSDTITGGSNNDQIRGNTGDDTLNGEAGDDIFHVSGAKDGYDNVQGGEGKDTILASDGDDTIGLNTFNADNSVEIIDGGEGTNVIQGNTYSDLDFSSTELKNIDEIRGGGGSNKITGTNQNDVIVGGRGDDTIDGGQGDDTFKVTGKDQGYDTVRGGEGKDTILTSDGDDTIGLNTFNADNSVEIIDGGEGTNVIQGNTYSDLDFSSTELKNIDEIRGGGGSNKITGTNQNDVIVGGRGDDTIDGGQGDDTFKVTGKDQGYDTVRGGEGKDTILASDGDDTIGLNSFNADNSVEIIDGGEGTNVIQGNTYSDLDFSSTELKNIDEIRGGGGSNKITGTNQNDVIVGGRGDDTIDGGQGDDTFKVTGKDQGYDTVQGGEGKDTILASDGDDTIGLNTFNADNSVEIIDGGEGTNVIQGNTYSNLDFSSTELKNIDEIRGGGGSNKITGTNQNDVIVGGRGDDTIDGGQGDDTFKVTGKDQGYDTVQGGEGKDTILASDGDDTIGLNTFNADNSVEIIDGGEGTNVIQGNTYSDLDFSSTELKNIDEIRGGGGSNKIIGSDSDDTILSGRGDDIITGASGNDSIDGGEGTDSAHYSGNIADYTITLNKDNSFTVQDDIADRDGTDTVSNVENFVFADGTVASGKLIDGAVEGIEYTSSSGLNGYTNEDGGFLFAEGDAITFNIGGVVLGVATAEDVASGKTFLQDIADVDRTDLNDEYLENMATFLQSIDENSDAYDGIVVTEEIREALENVDIDLRTASEEDVKDLVEQLGKTYVDEDAAMDHVEDMLVEHTDLEHDEFDEHVADESTDLEQALNAEQKKESKSSVVSSAAVTAAATDAVIQEFNEAVSSDLSLNIPSLTLPGEEAEGESNGQDEATVAAEKQETPVQSQNETAGALDEGNQQQGDILADDDLSNSLPSASLSNLFDDPVTAAGEENDQNDTIDNSEKQDGKTPEQAIAEAVDSTDSASTSSLNTTEKMEEPEESTEVLTETVVTEEQTVVAGDSDELIGEEASLSTDELSINLGMENDNETQATEQQADDTLDRFAADGKTEQTENNDLDKFSANDDSSHSEEMSSVDELDNSEAENSDQIEDAGLSADDGIQEELPPETEQVETNIG